MGTRNGAGCCWLALSALSRLALARSSSIGSFESESSPSTQWNSASHPGGRPMLAPLPLGLDMSGWFVDPACAREGGGERRVGMPSMPSARV